MPCLDPATDSQSEPVHVRVTLVAEDSELGAKAQFGSGRERVLQTERAAVLETGDSASRVVASAVQAHAVCICIDKEALLFEADGEEPLALAATVSLESKGTCCEFSADASFLALGDANGLVHLMHVNTASIALSLNLLNIAKANGFECAHAPISLIKFMGGHTPQTRVGGSSAFTEELVIVLENLIQLRFINIDFVQLGDAIASENAALASQTQAQISIQVSDLNRDSCGSLKDVVAVLPWKNALATMLVGSASATLTIWTNLGSLPSTFTDCLIGALDSDILKAECDQFGKYLVILETNKFLSIWDFKRIIMLKKYAAKLISDFVIMANHSGRNSGPALQVLTLLASSEKDHTRFLEVISFPGYDVLHRIEVSSHCWLLHHSIRGSMIDVRDCQTSDNKTQEIQATQLPSFGRFYYLEREELTSSEGGSRFFLHVLSETDATAKIQALVREAKFEEAEIVAAQFGLAMEYVLKEKLLTYLVGTSRLAADAVETVICHLNEVKDETFHLEFCLKAKTDSLATAYRLLSHARNHIISQGCGDGPRDLVDKIQQATHRLGTFELLSVRDQLQSGRATQLLNYTLLPLDEKEVVVPFQVEEWQEFRGIDLVEEMQRRMSIGDFYAVGLIWRRHCTDEGLYNHVMEILDELPEKSSLRELLPWLEDDLLPHVQTAELFTSIAEWVTSRAIAIESYQGNPHEARDIISLLDAQKQGTSGCTGSTDVKDLMPTFLACKPVTPGYYVQAVISHAQKSDVSTFGFSVWERRDELAKLKSQLEDLVDLWDTHKFKIYLCEYQTSSPASIALDLLDRVASFELLEDAVEIHFKPYVTKHALDFDALVNQYCLEIMDRYVGSGKILAGGPWESRILALFRYISSDEAKVSLLIDIMFRTPIPWSDSLDEEIVKALKVPHAKSTEITEQYRLMRLKKTLVFHGLENYNVSDVSKCKALLKFVLANLGSFSAMKEAMQIVSIYPQLSKIDAYIIRMRVLFKSGHIARGLSLLQTGYEFVASEEEFSESLQTPLEKELDIEILLEKLDQLSVAEEVFAWLVEVMESSVAEEDNFVFMASTCKIDFNWAVNAAVQLAEVLQRIKTHLKNETESSGVSNPILVNLVPSHLAALDMAGSCCSPETVLALKNIRDLSKEFDIRIGLGVYRTDEPSRRVVLNKFAKEVFKYGTDIGKHKSAQAGIVEFSRTELYRLAELLGFERSSLDGIIAEEAARNGDVKTALLLCKELFEKSADAASARTLKNIALLLTSFSAENKEVYRDIKETKVNFRLTKWILELCQKSLSVCDEDIIGECLDDFKNFEIQHAIFTQCDAGDYGTLLAATNSDILNIGSSNSIGSSSSSSSSQSPIVGSSSSFPVKWSLSTKLSDRSLDIEVASIGDSFGGLLFNEHCHEAGLVLPTEKAMGLVTDYILDLASAISQRAESVKLQHLLSPSISKSKNKGAASCDPVVSGQELAAYLKSNHALMTALRTWHRTLELRFRSSGSLYECSPSLEVIDLDACGHIRLVESLLENVFCSRSIDQNLALGALLTIEIEAGFEAFKRGMATTGRDFDRLLKFAAIGISASFAWNQRGFQVQCQDMAKNAQWWHQFVLLNIPVDIDAFKGSHSNEYQRALVSNLLQKTGFDVLTALEFARTYKIEDDFVIFEYIKLLLSNSVDNSDYQPRIAGVLDDVDNKQRLVTLFHEASSQCSPYSYEKLIFIFTQILRLDASDDKAAKGLKVLEVLSNYTRRSKPLPVELEYASEDLNAIHRSSRIPYQSLIRSAWTILEPEISQSSVLRLLPLAQPLGLTTDQFYIAVVESQLFRLRSPFPEGQAKLTVADFKPFLTKILSIQTAVKLSIAVAEAFPSGEDRISTFKLAENFARKLLHNEMDKFSPEQVKNLEAYCESIAGTLKATETEFKLRQAGLEQFVGLSHDPEQLIQVLYKTKSEAALAGFDLHSIVNDISERHGLDVARIRTLLLQRGLFFDTSVSIREKDLYLPSMRVQVNNLATSSEERSLQHQLLYIARSVSVQQGIEFFITFAYNTASKIRTLHRIRSLSLLFQLASPEQVDDFGKRYDEIRSYMQILLYLLDFEELRIVQTIKEFNDCDKEALVRSLWLNHSSETKVVQLICNLSLDFSIFDMNLWENALTRLVQLGAIRYLAGIIDVISNIPELSGMKSLPALWNRIILSSWDELSSQFDDGLHLRILSLLQKCPYLYDLDMNGIVQKIVSLSSNDQNSATESKIRLVLQSLFCLPPHPKVLSACKALLLSQPTAFLVQILHQYQGRNSFSFMDYVRSQIFCVIHSRREYAALDQHSIISPAFFQYLVSIGETEPLVIELRKAGRGEEADKIVDFIASKEQSF
ncbi:rough deal protein C-terminal region-domain-containing protein [Chytriomyces sp. MP71]|nr:rough deal protein C-terminal region-domain-containing protein [Chytriomyces sp. MP71]